MFSPRSINSIQDVYEFRMLYLHIDEGKSNIAKQQQQQQKTVGSLRKLFSYLTKVSKVVFFRLVRTSKPETSFYNLWRKRG